jgi:hypothetical protein
MRIACRRWCCDDLGLVRVALVAQFGENADGKRNQQERGDNRAKRPDMPSALPSFK